MTTGHSNPLQLDDRTGSGDLLPLLRSRAIPTVLTRLTYGDAAFMGRGPEDCPLPIGIEIKQLSDVLKCITDGRFAGHQLPGLVASYAYTWLAIEGIYRADTQSGLLQTFAKGTWRSATIGSRTFMSRELDHWLLTISVKGGVRIVRTSNRDDTTLFLAHLYRWWTDKSLDEHRAHLAADTSHMPDSALFTRPTLSRLVAKELPGIGWEKAAQVAKAFPTVAELACADVADWLGIPGIGPKTAEKVVRALRTGKTS